MTEKKLTVDKAWRLKAKPNHFLIEIEGKYYLLPISKTTLDNAIEPERQWAEGMVKSSEELNDVDYWLYGLIKKTGYDVKIGRAITPKELTELRGRLNLTDDKVSAPFENVSGKIFGEEYAKTFTSIQIAVGTMEASRIAAEIQKAGIQASNGSPGRINIRIK